MPQIFPPVLELSTLNGFNGFTLNGVAVNDRASWSLVSADINGDGRPDMLIGADYASPGGRSNAGSVFVVFGQGSPFNATVELSALNGSNGFRLNGVSAGDGAGYSLSSADINGDARYADRGCYRFPWRPP
jgi:hypothetical protein